MTDFISFSANFCPSHAYVWDLALRDQLRRLVPDIAKPVIAVSFKEGNHKLEVELEKIAGSRPTFYVDIEEVIPDKNGGIFRSLIMDAETGYVTDMN